ncbi:4'-phosphopantetheinyl transferase family protein [Microbacterium karelineae]|uniref:4'-phosphopantetheinyl transferase family protein n=1 Tax=Microbacterium karelineae TaxID=2654283 RepID=UPI0018D48F99|nr:4'-phosphopantetheinyl transferase superfamily protein [Microbacterium karelineae]
MTAPDIGGILPPGIASAWTTGDAVGILAERVNTSDTSGAVGDRRSVRRAGNGETRGGGARAGGTRDDGTRAGTTLVAGARNTGAPHTGTQDRETRDGGARHVGAPLAGTRDDETTDRGARKAVAPHGGTAARRACAATVGGAGSRPDAEMSGILAEEAPFIARAVPRRRAEFQAARACARRALADLGEPPAPIPPGHDRAPVWPRGIVGSLTHCDGYRAAAVARADLVAAIGIDAEVHAPLPGDVAELVFADGDREALARIRSARPDVHADRLLFSAKESVYKAWHPLTREWLGFEECRIDLSPDGTFRAHVLRPAPAELRVLDGRWAVGGGHIVTAVIVPA